MATYTRTEHYHHMKQVCEFIFSFYQNVLGWFIYLYIIIIYFLNFCCPHHLMLHHSEENLKLNLLVHDTCKCEVHDLIFFGQVWRNIRTACGDQADLIHLAETLSQKFEVLYKKEVCWYRSASFPFLFSLLTISFHV